MKALQAGILVCLIVIAGLLGAIYHNQRSQPSAEPLAEMKANLDGQPAAAESITLAEAPAAQPVAEAKPSPALVRTQARPPAPKVKPAVQRRPTPVESAPQPEQASEPAITQPLQPAPVAEPTPAPAPPPPPEPRIVTIPAGTELRVRTVQTLSSDRNSDGDTFLATLDDHLMIDNVIVAEKGARIEGRVVEARRAGRVKDVSSLVVELTGLETADGQMVDIATQRIHRQGEQSKGNDAKKIGIATGIGAAIGAIAGGGKGAAIGAGAGAGAGTGTVLATRGEDVSIRSESRLQFRLLDSVQVIEKL